MTDPNLTLIAVVLDRSGSMGPLRQATLAGLNKFLQTQRELPGEVRLHLVEFDDKYEIHRDMVDLRTMQDLTEKDYEPRGWTALLDAVGLTVTDVGKRLAATPEHLRPGKVIFVIQTDGQENSSREYAYPQIQDLIARQRDTYSWEFIFLGANQDAILAGGQLGVLGGACLSYNASTVSTAKVFQAVSRSVGSYRSGMTTNAGTYTDVLRSYVSDDSKPVDPSVDLNVVVGTTTDNKP